MTSCCMNFAIISSNGYLFHQWKGKKKRNAIILPKYNINPDSKVHGANMGPTWALSAPGGPHVGPMNLAIREAIKRRGHKEVTYTVEMKAYLRTWTTQYEDRRQEIEASVPCSLLHRNWEQILWRCPSVHLSICPSVCPACRVHCNAYSSG